MLDTGLRRHDKSFFVKEGFANTRSLHYAHLKKNHRRADYFYNYSGHYRFFYRAAASEAVHHEKDVRSTAP
jgi:hypothetical protein